MLNGIGGRTIEEAKKNISYHEFILWLQYRHKRGSFNLGMRVERGAALNACVYLNAKSLNHKYSLYDFMPNEEAPPQTLFQAMNEWR